MGAHAKNILKLQAYVLDKNKASLADAGKLTPASELLRNGRPVGNRDGQYDKPANSQP